MNKLFYWLRKLGILRTAKPRVVKGNKKLNEMNASDYGVIQGQKEIDENYKPKQEK